MMAVMKDLASSSASIVLAVGDKTQRTPISGLVKDIDKDAIYAVAKKINACQAHSMKELRITQTTVMSEA